MRKSGAIVGLMLSALALTARSAEATTITVNRTLGCWTFNTVAECGTAPGGAVTLGDKTFTSQGANLANYQNVAFTWDDGGTAGTFADDVFSVQLQGLSTLDYNTSLVYYVTINHPAYYFSTVSLSSVQNIRGYSVTKTINGGFNYNTTLGTLTSTDGSSAGPLAISGQSILVRDAFDVSQGGRLDSVTNTFTQASAVPEPSTWLLVGMGVTALAARRIRRRTSNELP
jgi:hypothetical protein